MKRASLYSISYGLVCLVGLMAVSLWPSDNAKWLVMFDTATPPAAMASAALLAGADIVDMPTSGRLIIQTHAGTNTDALYNNGAYFIVRALPSYGCAPTGKRVGASALAPTPKPAETARAVSDNKDLKNTAQKGRISLPERPPTNSLS